MSYTYVTGANSASWYPSGSSVARHINARLYYEIAQNDATTYKVNFYGQGSVYKDNLGTTMWGKLYNAGAQIGPAQSHVYTYSSKGTNHTDVYYTLVPTQTITITKTHSAQSRVIAAKAYRDGAESTIYSQASVTFSIPAKYSYTVSYNANGGSGSTASQTKWYGENLQINGNGFSRTGYTFNRWSTNSAGTGTTYYGGSTYTGNSAMTLYAIWTINTWTVSFNANGGTGAPSNQTKTYGQTLTLSSTKPTRTGYTFKGWATSSGGAVAYQAGGSYTANAGATLYAVWQANTYTISYNANGGRGAEASQTKTYDAVLSPLRDGSNMSYAVELGAHDLLGWDTNPNATTPTYSLGGTFSTNITADTTLYAIWQYSYIKTSLSDLTVIRTRYNTAADTDEYEEGAYLLVSFKWTGYSNDGGLTYNTPYCQVAVAPDGDLYLLELTGTASGTPTTFSYKISTKAYSPDLAFKLIVVSMDPDKTEEEYAAIATIGVPSALYQIDAIADSTTNEVFMGVQTPAVSGQPLTTPEVYAKDIVLYFDENDYRVEGYGGYLYDALLAVGWIDAE